VRVGGRERALVKAALRGMHHALWSPESARSPGRPALAGEES
jgi:hypothetical protein